MVGEHYQEEYCQQDDDVTNTKNRYPTDKLWALFAIVLAGTTAGVPFLLRAEHSKVPVVSHGHLKCRAYAERPFLLYLDARNCSDFDECNERSICVRECPIYSFNLDECHTSKNFHGSDSGIACDDPSILDSVRSCGELNSLYKAGRCTKYNEFSKPENNICRPRNWPASPLIIPTIVGISSGLLILIISLFCLGSMNQLTFWITTITGAILGTTVVFSFLLHQHLKWARSTGIILAIYLFVRIPVISINIRRFRYGIELVKEAALAIKNLPKMGFATGMLTHIIFRYLTFGCVLYGFQFIIFGEKIYRIKGAGGNCECKVNYTNGDYCIPKQFRLDCPTAAVSCPEMLCASIGYGLTELTYYLAVALIISYIFTVAALVSFEKMKTAYNVAQWYFKEDRSPLDFAAMQQADLIMVKNHIGTTVVGSLKKTMMRIPCFLLPLLGLIGQLGTIPNDAFLIKDKSLLVSSIYGISSSQSIAWCKRVSEGQSTFLSAIRDVSYLIVNTLKLTVAFVSVAIMYTVVKMTMDHPWSNEWLVIAVIFVFTVTYLLGDVLLMHHQATIDALVICAYDDWSRTRASKSYFSSETLNDLLVDSKVEEAQDLSRDMNF